MELWRDRATPFANLKLRYSGSRRTCRSACSGDPLRLRQIITNFIG